MQSREPNPVAAVGLESRRRRTRIVPVEPHDDLRGGRDVVAGVRKHVGDELVGLEFHPHPADIAALARTRAVAVLGAVPPRGPLADEAAEALRGAGLDVAPVRVGQRAAFVHAATAGAGVLEHAPGSRAADEVRALYAWVVGTITRTEERAA